MELEGRGLVIRINPAAQSDEWLASAAREIADAISARGLKPPFSAGTRTTRTEKQEPESATSPAYPTKEYFVEQLPSALIGFEAIVHALKVGRRKKVADVVAIDKAVSAEFEGWFCQDKLAYIAAAEDADPNVRFTLVATPNITIAFKSLTNIAKAFGQHQPFGTYLWNPLYSRYTPEQLSGTDPRNGNAVVFSLIPSAYTIGMEGTVADQRAKLQMLQNDYPALKVPSPLEAVTHWQTLRAQGERLADDTTHNRTYVRHFDLPEQRIDDWLRVPDSYIDGDGKPFLNYSSARYESRARISVG